MGNACPWVWSPPAAPAMCHQSKGTMMRKFFWLIAAAFAAVAVTSSIALAAVNVKSLPTATFSGASVTLTGGNFSGLGTWRHSRT